MRYLQWLLFILNLGPIELFIFHFFNLWFFRGPHKVRVTGLGDYFCLEIPPCGWRGISAVYNTSPQMTVEINPGIQKICPWIKIKTVWRATFNGIPQLCEANVCKVIFTTSSVLLNFKNITGHK